MEESFSSLISSLSSFISSGCGLNTNSISPDSLGPSASSPGLASLLDPAPDSFSEVLRGFFTFGPNVDDEELVGVVELFVGAEALGAALVFVVVGVLGVSLGVGVDGAEGVGVGVAPSSCIAFRLF